MSRSSIPIYNAPLAFDQNLNKVKGFEPQGAEGRNRHDVQDSREWTVGPMPISDFLENFLLPYDKDCDKNAMKSSWKAFNSVPPWGHKPSDIYVPLVKALNISTKHKSRCPGFVFDNASARSPHPHQLGFMKPHICVYRRENLDLIRQSDPLSRTELGYAELFIEVTADPSHDPFVDPPGNVSEEARAAHDFVLQPEDERLARSIDRSFGQQIAYATEIMARQCRTCVYSIALSGSRARFLRWDRQGCIITESFDIRAQPEFLCDFLWRFSTTSNGGRGHDPTVQVASAVDEEVFLKAIKEYVRIQLEVEGEELTRAVSEHYQPGHVFVVHVLAQDAVANANTMRQYFVSRPVIVPFTLVGRGTKGFWAVDALTGKVVFLKDTWHIRGIEGLNLARMNQRGVRNIPSLESHGDVPDVLPEEGRKLELSEFQSTMTDEFCEDSWACNVRGQKVEVLKRVHYRLVLGTVGYGLKTFRGSEELLHATYDVLQAMADALNKDSRLHRDVSVNNIILVKEPDRRVRRGYLIDWDASSPVDESEASVFIGRAGTWEFMSHALLDTSGLRRQSTIKDDLESLLYVVLYCCFLWLPHGLPPWTLENTIAGFFEFRSELSGTIYGGSGKTANMMARLYTMYADFPPPVKCWVDCVSDLYCPIRGEEDAERVKNCTGTHHTYPSRERRMWTLEAVDKFWSEFLQTHTLDPRDRVTHDHPRSTGVYDTNDTPPSHPSYGCAVPQKRTIEGGGEDLQPRKRIRTSKPSPLSIPRRSPRKHSRLATASTPSNTQTSKLQTRPGPRKVSRTSRKS